MSLVPNSARSSLLYKCALALAILLLSASLFAYFSPSVGAQEQALQTAQSFGLIRTLGPVDYVEVNTPNANGTPKQLMVFVHGTPGSLTAFSRYLNDPIMRENFHMISVTRPGWKNDADAKLPSLTDQAVALEPFLRMDNSGKGTILMAHSYGGPVIARMAMDYSDRVAGLVFVATTANPELSGPRWYNRVAVILPKFVLGASLKGANAEIMPLKAQLQAMLPRWQDLTMPALIVQGGSDSLVNPGNALFLQRMLVNSDVSYLYREGQGHFVLWEEAELIRNTLVQKFGAGQSKLEELLTD